MLYPVVKVLISAALITVISEIAKRSSLLGEIFASIPLVSVLAMICMYVDTHNTYEIVLLPKGVFWLALPLLVLFSYIPFIYKIAVEFLYGSASGNRANSHCLFSNGDDFRKICG